MAITRLDIHRIRNIQQATLSPSPGVNLLWGANGSGKTSILEAIHMLSVARSFRTHKVKTVIAHGEPQCTLFARLRHLEEPEMTVGVQRQLDGDNQIRIGAGQPSNLAELARLLPLQVINPDAFRLLEGSPSERRHFLDWGVFHQEILFFDCWRRYQRALKQRNSLLKYARIDPLLRASWEAELVTQAAAIDEMRKAYLARFSPVFQDYLAKLTGLEDIALHYYPGWDAKRSLDDVLQSSAARDQELGFTQHGPHRADMRIRCGPRAAVDVLSRGQQKMVVCAMKLAQGQVLASDHQRQPIYLIDDLPAELDRDHRQALCELIEELACQVFITSVEADVLDECWSSGCQVKLFHVEQGLITEC
ncbi:recombinase RecF [Pokkaliibacter plantistimulans]|uniref:DNA replication and repair protein RecF n=1 Tax=Pokkaliibacter plantistimulans TaxID=1635171 RepID=A0ABX5LW88_9GAMM|nr:DNA replication/repair protein RecF [Pokkaliibacter plantistimulans]PXF30927.1 recombinase RecF [Pokkaliibacter plantistimulans]